MLDSDVMQQDEVNTHTHADDQTFTRLLDSGRKANNGGRQTGFLKLPLQASRTCCFIRAAGLLVLSHTYSFSHFNRFTLLDH